MRNRNLLKNPCWSSKDLGQAMPDSPHAVSVALPNWDDVIAYEEKDPKCMQSLQAIYPRFGLNHLVAEVAKEACANHASKVINAWPFPNLKTVTKAREFCALNAPNSDIIIKEVLGLYCLITDEISSPYAKAFWQHTGLGASSRLASIALKKENPPQSNLGEKAREIIRRRLANIYDCNTNAISLHPSGMAAFAEALEIITKIRPNKPFLQVGFPYVDVLKLPDVVFSGSLLLTKTDPKHVAKELDRLQPAALIVELPSNPMLQCIDLKKISKLAKERDIPIIADDTIGSAWNINAIPFADLIFSSLTKTYAGRGDILAGSLLISPYSKYKEKLSKIFEETHLVQLADADAIELAKTSKDFQVRIKKLNQSCLKLKKRLEDHQSIEKVHHPEDCDNFKALLKPEGGYGCLLSIELKGGLEKTKAFYNALQVCKGPSLGTNFTLVCPYVLLAHYKELDWAYKCGVPTHLLRVSVGLENPDELWERFKHALSITA